MPREDAARDTVERAAVQSSVKWITLARLRGPFAEPWWVLKASLAAVGGDEQPRLSWRPGQNLG